MPWAVAGAAIGAAGSYMSSKNNKEAAEIGAQNKIDPRIGNIVFGQNGNDGLVNQYQGLYNTPGYNAAQNYSSANANYLNQYGGQDLNSIHNAATGLMSQTTAPQTGQGWAAIPAYDVGSMVNAPSQNNLDLSGTFNSLLSGGNNQALRDSLQYGTDLTNAQFAKNQTDVTNNLMRNVLPSLGSGAIAAGQYGGSRQGIAEGNALSDYTNQLTNANTQLGLANSANTTGQLANDYQQGQNRALSAAQGLSAQQYGVASQNANTLNQAEFNNVANSYDDSKYNAGLDQQSKLANLQSQLQTKQLNNAGAATGAELLGGLLGQTNSGLSSATGYSQGVNNLLQPYLSLNQTQTQPTFQNTAGNVLGGAMLGSQIGGLFGGSSPYSSIRSQDNYGVNTGYGLSSLGNMLNSSSSSITF